MSFSFVLFEKILLAEFTCEKYQVAISYASNVMTKVNYFCHRVRESQTDRESESQTDKLDAPESIPGA